MNTDICLVCGMMFRNPLLSFEEQKKYYTESYYNDFKITSSKIDSFYEIFQKRKEKNEIHIQFILKSGVSLDNKRILDVGCGRGVLLHLFSKYNPSELIGIEPSTDVCSQINLDLNLRFKVLEGSYMDYSSKKIGKFDLISLTGVIEHLSSPVEALCHLSTLLNKDGKIYVHTHDETASFRFDIKKRISLVHQLYFTKKTMKICLEKSGLKLEKMQVDGSNMFLLAGKFTANSLSKIESNTNISVLKFRMSFFKGLPNFIYELFEKLNNRYYLIKNKIVENKLKIVIK
jgi:2-polyprenyl-3-methyl-5-hydroxy-6-metoxy-1,4-benzoquinol methylase